MATVRGRPRKNLPKKDLGTEQLQQKRRSKATSEILDLCMQNDIITVKQRDAGIRLRWLYTLKFGAPGISAYDPLLKGIDCCYYEDEQWLSTRSKEYENILYNLNRVNAKKIVTDICIFNIRPKFLTNSKINYQSALNSERSILKLTEGLDLIYDVTNNKRLLAN